MKNFDTLFEYSQTISPSANPKICGNTLTASQYLRPLEIISQYLPAQTPLKVLDWGCGCGHFSYFLLKQGWEVDAYSFDTSEATLKKQELYDSIFHRKWNLTVSDRSDPVRLPYPDAHFDAVLSVGVLEHVAENGGNEVASLNEIYRILKPEGQLLIFHFPNRYSWIEKAVQALRALKLSSAFSHQFLYRLSDIEKMVSQTPFTLLESDLYNLFPRGVLRKLPSSIGNSKVAASALTFLEQIAHSMLGNFAQNYFFVLKKDKLPH